ncbi:XkdW protein [compost metagenome]
MAVDYNRLNLGKDYDIVERGQYIAAWHLPEPQPTEAELLAAWDTIKDLPPEPTPPTDAERIAALETDSINTMIAVTESFETQQAADSQREQETTNTMLALAEAYEIILQQQEAMATMAARIDALEAQKGGVS